MTDKTVKELMQEVLTPVELDQFIKNTTKKFRNPIDQRLAFIVIDAFYWEDSPEGYDYWCAIYHRLQGVTG